MDTLLPTLELRAENLAQRFNRRLVWQNVSLEVRNKEILGITGDNGSGKTTLLRALCGLLTPTSGKVTLTVEGITVETDAIIRHLGFVAPYLTVYEEFTPLEHCAIIANMHGAVLEIDYANELLAKFRLYERRNDEIRGFSSGMKQRMKYVLALLFRVPLLVLDEPMTNLDEAGTTAVETLIRDHQEHGGACIIATNDARDLALCTKRLAVTDYSDKIAPDIPAPASLHSIHAVSAMVFGVTQFTISSGAPHSRFAGVSIMPGTRQFALTP